MYTLNYADTGSTPMLIAVEDMDPETFISYYHDNRQEIEQNLLETGAIKFRGIEVASLSAFQRIVDAISSKFMSYIDGNSPRIKLSGNVYTSTEFDKSQRITMHNELSYSAKWPNKLFFSCLQTAAAGGETLLADSRQILEKMDDSIVTAIRKKGIEYIRNLHGGEGIGPSWQATFETEDRSVVEGYCRSYGIAFEWGEWGALRLIQSAKGIIRHRITGEEVWFNQIDQFHPCHLGEEMSETMNMLYGEAENFPMHVRFGDKTEITESFVREIMKTIDSVTVAPPWQRNELLIVDNELVSHGRNPYTGERKVLVSMSE